MLKQVTMKLKENRVTIKNKIFTHVPKHQTQLPNCFLIIAVNM